MASVASPPSAARGVFARDEIAAFAPFVAAARARKTNNREQLPTASATLAAAPSTALASADTSDADAGVAAPVIDRVFEYSSHFKLDEPFTIRLRKGETVLLPLEPIHDLLFPSSVASSLTSANSTDGELRMHADAAASPFAIGLELSNCQGKVQTFIMNKDNHAHRFSTASYQCVTLTQANEAQQQRVNLCPHYDPEFPVGMRVDPHEVKGFVLRADVDASVESIALLRSTKSSGGFEKAFVTDDAEPSQSPFNVSFSYEATTLGFESPSIWEHLGASRDGWSTKLDACEACDYFLYAEKLETNQTVSSSSLYQEEPATSSSSQLALPYCIRQRSSVQYKLPKLTTSSSPRTAAGEKVHHNVKLDDLFADHFRSSGEYRFVLMASLPSAANHHHAAMLAYAPQQLSVTVPPFYQSHFFIAFVAVALLAVAAIVQVQYRPYRRFLPKAKPSASDAEDETEFVSLLARSAVSPGREDALDSLEEGLLHSDDDGGEDELLAAGSSGIRERSSLLEAIKRTKEQPVVQLDGYHEIN